MALAFEVLRSDSIFLNSKARRDLLGVDVRIGNKVCNKLLQDGSQRQVERHVDQDETNTDESITSLRLSNTKLPTIFSRNSLSRVVWCKLSICISS